MRILQLIQKKQYRGAEIFCCQLSNHLGDLGHEVEVYSIYDGNAILPFTYKEVQSLGRNPKLRFFDYYGWQQIAQVIDEFKPDVIQANAADTLKYAVLSKIFFKWECPIIYRNASAFSFYAKSRFSRTLNSFLLKNVDKIISVSQASMRDINQLFPFTIDKSSVIPVGIEEKRNLKNIAPVRFKNKLNIIHIGSLTKEKNHLAILKIFKQVQSEIPGVGLQLLGDGPLRKEISQRVRELGLEKSVHFYGEIQDPFPYLRSSDVLILPSIIEGLPGVVLEAMYCQIPVVAYKVGGISEVVNNETGNLIEEGDERSFAEAIIEELKKSDKSKINNAFVMVKRNFVNKALAKKFVEVYKHLITR